MNVKNKSLLSPELIIKACRYKSLEDIKLIFDHYPVDCKDGYNNTPLHEAAIWGREDLVQYLLEKGADPKVEDKYGRTPLYWAEKRGHKPIVELFISELRF